MEYIGDWMLHDMAETGSTNDEVKKLSANIRGQKVVISARSQTNGRGRRGRGWVSLDGNLFFSLGVENELKNLGALVFIASLSLWQTVRNLDPLLNVKLKWPNDVLVNDKKISGMLLEKGAGDYWVIGIGVNVTQQREDFPEELRDKAISVREAGAAVPRAAIAAGIITRLDDLFLRQHILSQPAENLIGELTRRSCTIGRRVEVISPTGQYEALAVAIAPDAGLIVELPDGSRRTVSSGEVSVRGLLGYT